MSADPLQSGGVIGVSNTPITAPTQLPVSQNTSSAMDDLSQLTHVATAATTIPDVAHSASSSIISRPVGSVGDKSKNGYSKMQVNGYSKSIKASRSDNWVDFLTKHRRRRLEDNTILSETKSLVDDNIQVNPISPIQSQSTQSDFIQSDHTQSASTQSIQEGNDQSLSIDKMNLNSSKDVAGDVSSISSNIVSQTSSTTQVIDDQARVTDDSVSANLPAQDDLVAHSVKPEDQSMLTDDEKLNIFSDAIDYAESQSSVLDQVLPGVMLANDPLNPSQVTASRAGAPELAKSATLPVEAINRSQVENEKHAELPVEVEGFLQRVEDHANKLPQEIVLADGNPQLVTQPRPTTSVVVLPITQDTEKKAIGKSTKFSISWLVAWSRKMIKKFAGAIIYRQVVVEQNTN